MTAKLVFLGRLADLADAGECAVATPLDWHGLLAKLGQPLSSDVAGDRVRIAVNGVVLADKTALVVKDGDEVALLPPVSGG